MDTRFKSAIYNTKEGVKTFYYDPNSPCIMCGKPVVEASTGGTAICPCCDIGVHRDGTPWSYKETLEMGKRAAAKYFMQKLEN